MTTNIPALPHMDAAGIEAFQSHIATSECLLEYGSGGSTIFASRFANLRKIYSVDSDRAWVDSVFQKADNAEKLCITHVDIGATRDWGNPVNNEKFSDWWSYMATPWLIASKDRQRVDLVLIDGRFRVACFLYSLFCSEPGTRILFDDYIDRNEYHLVEKYAGSPVFFGRMALFVKGELKDLPSLLADIAKYSVRYG